MTFDENSAARYEAWYETSEGRRADELEKDILVRLLNRFPDAESILEIGCGTGHFTRWFSRHGLTAVGLDLSAAMLAEAQRLDGLPLIRGDALTLPFADGTFDLTALITTLEFLNRPKDALTEALRVARRGVVLGVLNRWSVLGLQRRLKGLFQPTVYDAARFYSVGELKSLLDSVAEQEYHIVWRTTLFPRSCPWTRARLPWGGFIGIAGISKRYRSQNTPRHPGKALTRRQGNRLGLMKNKNA